ncbi:HAMP domain-containing histidine kinase [Kocuria flava]|uniref:sensor histidine kinase n=1 Tax=Kocuria flava TaxID=446860 RepID=UPI001FF41C6B|nr:HAMP domain-containing sensor histidine kinase [Kocuria flava]MCJ8505448.1 HAMP domain-containing histidine kinase [Kocuria flava]
MAGTRWERLRTELRSVRSRVLATVLAVLAAALLLVGGLTHYLRLVDVDESVRQDIVQEAGELQRLAQRGPLGPDASPTEDLDATAEEPFADLDQLFYTFLTTTVPGEYEAILAVVDGEPAFEHADRSGFQLDDPATLAAVAERSRPGQTVVFDHRQGERQLRLGVIPVDLAADDRPAHLVVGFDMSAQRGLVLESLGRYLAIAGLTLVVAGLAAYVLVGRVTAPITRLRRATEQISPDDLGRRVPVTREDSDVGQLAVNFNGMLARIEAGFRQQRQFLDDAAHELRTPLTILHGNLELMDEHDPADVAETRAVLLDEIGRMNRLVEDLLLLAKAQRADFVRPGTVDLGPWLDTTLERARALGERDWRLDARAEGLVRADEQRLTQAVLQLAANAVKFSAPGDVVALGTAGSTGSAAPGTGRELEIWVRDTGPGIAEADQQRIFERFARAETGRTVEGSGLGLAIVAAIAHAHGGDVRVRSRPGAGATFTVRLPLDPAGRAAPTGPPALAAPASPAGEPAPPPGGARAPAAGEHGPGAGTHRAGTPGTGPHPSRTHESRK